MPKTGNSINRINANKRLFLVTYDVLADNMYDALADNVYGALVPPLKAQLMPPPLLFCCHTRSSQNAHLLNPIVKTFNKLTAAQPLPVSHVLSSPGRRTSRGVDLLHKVRGDDTPYPRHAPGQQLAVVKAIAANVPHDLDNLPSFKRKFVGVAAGAHVGGRHAWRVVVQRNKVPRRRGAIGGRGALGQGHLRWCRHRNVAGVSSSDASLIAIILHASETKRRGGYREAWHSR